MGARPDYERVAYTVPEMLRAGATPWVSQRSPVEGASTEMVADRAEEPAALAARPVRRRLTGKQPDPLQAGSQVVKEHASGHLFAAKGRLTYCERCGHWSLDRVSKALTRRCPGNVDTVRGAYRVRRERMRAGRHPLTNIPLL